MPDFAFNWVLFGDGGSGERETGSAQISSQGKKKGMLAGEVSQCVHKDLAGQA